jgi:hypothetical protein
MRYRSFGVYAEEDSIEGLELASDFIQEAARALRKEIPVCGVLICRVDMRYRKEPERRGKNSPLFVPQYPIYQEMIPDRVVWQMLVISK